MAFILKRIVLFSFTCILMSNLCFSQSENIKGEYETLKKTINETKQQFEDNYLRSDSTQFDSLILEARKYILSTITQDLFSYWYGTKWDFNGHTRVPQQGSIACGYFITTILSDAGFNIPVIKWAQTPSEVFIRKLSKPHVKSFSNKPISVIEEYLLKSGDGLYIVGLDCHVGFILVQNQEIRFIHANYYYPEKGVMKEKIDSYNPLNHSKYRIIGKLFSDEMIVNWITGKAYD